MEFKSSTKNPTEEWSTFLCRRAVISRGGMDWYRLGELLEIISPSCQKAMLHYHKLASRGKRCVDINVLSDSILMALTIFQQEHNIFEEGEAGPETLNRIRTLICERETSAKISF